jgi:hypothetical protein
LALHRKATRVIPLSRTAALVLVGVLAPLAVRAAPAAQAKADWIKNPVAVFTGLDKITGRAVDFTARIGQTVKYGALRVTPRVCFTKPPTEQPRTDAFIQIDEITLEGKKKRIFSGWMFAASPGLNALEHPIYDVWLKGCSDGSAAAKGAPDHG